MRRIDISLPALLPVGVVLVLVGQWLEGGTVAGLLQGTAALIVFGGTLGAVLISFPIEDLRAARSGFAELLWSEQEPAAAAIARAVRYAAMVRRKGLLALEVELEHEPDPVLRRGLTLAVDGISAAAIVPILEHETATLDEHGERGAQVFESAGGYAPTLGILGAVLGLIHVMQNLSDPGRLGGGIAVAFVATVYGVGAANLLLLPIASRLRQHAARATRRRELMVRAVVGIQEGQNPRVLAQQLASLVPPGEQSGELRRARVA